MTPATATRALMAQADGDGADDVAILERAISMTTDPGTGQPMAARQFAMQILRIDERTMRRYISPDPALRRRIPGPVIAVAQAIIASNGRAATAAAVDPRAAAKAALDAKLASLTEVQREVWNVLDVYHTAPDIADATERHVTAVRQALKTLKVAGLADGEPGKTWRRT